MQGWLLRVGHVKLGHLHDAQQGFALLLGWQGRHVGQEAAHTVGDGLGFLFGQAAGSQLAIAAGDLHFNRVDLGLGFVDADSQHLVDHAGLPAEVDQGLALVAERRQLLFQCGASISDRLGLALGMAGNRHHPLGIVAMSAGGMDGTSHQRFLNRFGREILGLAAPLPPLDTPEVWVHGTGLATRMHPAQRAAAGSAPQDASPDPHPLGLVAGQRFALRAKGIPARIHRGADFLKSCPIDQHTDDAFRAQQARHLHRAPLLGCVAIAPQRHPAAIEKVGHVNKA